MGQLNARLDAVAELKSNEARIATLRKALEGVKAVDLEKLVASIATYDKQTMLLGSGRTQKQLGEVDPAREADKNLGKIFQLRTFMSAIPALKAALDQMQSETLAHAGELLAKEDMSKILIEINETLNTDVIASAQSKANQFGARAQKGQHAVDPYPAGRAD